MICERAVERRCARGGLRVGDSKNSSTEAAPGARSRERALVHAGRASWPRTAAGHLPAAGPFSASVVLTTSSLCSATLYDYFQSPGRTGSLIRLGLTTPFHELLVVLRIVAVLRLIQLDRAYSIRDFEICFAPHPRSGIPVCTDTAHPGSSGRPRFDSIR